MSLQNTSLPALLMLAGGVIEALPFRQIHGSSETLGFRFGGLAYSPDVSDFPEESHEALRVEHERTRRQSMSGFGFRDYRGSSRRIRYARAQHTMRSAAIVIFFPRFQN